MITGLFATPGSRVSSGHVVVAVANRPVIVLAGRTPAYRMLREGMTGPDVTQLQSGLKAIGFRIGADRSGTYGRGTAQATAALYRSKRFAPRDAGGLELDRARSSDTVVPFGEILFIDGLPGTVLEVRGSLGNIVENEIMSIGSGSQSLVGTIPPIDAPQVRRGNLAEIRFEGGEVVPARVTEVTVADAGRSSTESSATGGSGARTEGQARVLLVPLPPIPQEVVGQSGQLTVVVSESEATSLIVPVTAVFTSADGSTWLQIVEGTLRRKLVVMVGLVTGGRAVVTPVHGELKKDDEVLIAESHTLYQASTVGS